MSGKRISDYQELSELKNTSYVMTDDDTSGDGSKKFKIKTLKDAIDSAVGALGERIDTEATARQNAIAAEVTERQEADSDLEEYINEVNSTLTEEVSARQAADTAMEAEVSDLKEDLSELVEIPGENLIALTDFVAHTGTSVTVDDTDNSITVTTTSAGTYRCAQTATTFISNNLEIGKTYRLHAKAEKVSGNPIARIAIRGVNGNADGVAESIILDDEEGWFDFVVDEYMLRITLFITWSTSASASVKFSEIWLKEYGVDKGARDDIDTLNYRMGDEYKRYPDAIRQGGASGSVGTKINLTSNEANWRRTVVDASKYKRFRITTRVMNYSTPVTYVWMCDADGTILDVLQHTQTVGDAYHTDYITVSDDVKLLYIRSYTGNNSTYNLNAITVEYIEPDIQDSIHKALPSVSASGMVVHISDGADDVNAVQVTYDVVQSQPKSGTSSPTNVRPIGASGYASIIRCGKNLSTIKSAVPVTTGTIRITSSTRAGMLRSIGSTSRKWIVSFDLIDADYTNKSQNTVFFNFNNGNNDSYVYSHQLRRVSDDVQINTLEPPFNGRFYAQYTGILSTINCYFNSESYGHWIGQMDNIMVTYDEDTPIDYVDCTYGDFYVNFGLSDFYKGTLDATNGILTKTHDMATVNDAWVRGNVNNAGTGRIFYINPPTGRFTTYSEGRYSNYLTPTTYTSAYEELPANSFNEVSNTTQRALIVCSANPDDTLATFKEWWTNNGIQLLLPLKTANRVTYQIDPMDVRTLKGENNIFASTGAISLTYRADPQLYVERRLAETKSIIAGIETSMTATKNYSVGDMLIVGDNLYKVTSAIATGGAITEGTNVTATTVAEQLIALANA